MKTFNTYLPVFDGFYGTLFEPSLEYEEDQEKEYLQENYEVDPNKIDISDYFDNKSYQNQVGKYACYFIAYKLEDYIHKIEFKGIISPREYNFTNDSIECDITLKMEAIKEYIYNNLETFEKYLKDNLTSYSGFHSLTYNNLEGWEEYTKNFTDYSEHYFLLGQVLNFICENEKIDSEGMYYYVSENINYSEFFDYSKLTIKNPQ